MTSLVNTSTRVPISQFLLLRGAVRFAEPGDPVTGPLEDPVVAASS